MGDKPSFCTSTLSILAVWSVVAFTLAAFAVGAGITFGKLDERSAILIMTPFGTILTGFGMSYLTARKNNGNPPPAGGAVA